MGAMMRPKLLLQLLPLLTWGVPLSGNPQVRSGAASGNRTPDLLITSELLWPTELRRRCRYSKVSVAIACRGFAGPLLTALQRAGHRLHGDGGLTLSSSASRQASTACCRPTHALAGESR